MKSAFYYKDQRLFCEQIDLTEFAANYETPFYIYSRQEIGRCCREILDAGRALDYLPCYALKANYNPALLKIIREFGFGADVVSGGELSFALKAGFAPDKIVFAGVGKTAKEIELAIETGIHSLNIESAEELELTSHIAARLQKRVRIAIRINPDIEAQTHHYISTGRHINKFGVSADEAEALYLCARDDQWLEPCGVHVHLGSQITKTEPYLIAVEFLRQFISRLKKSGVAISYLDLGGGIGINYHTDFMAAAEKTTYLQEILPSYLNGFRDLGIKLLVELGRALVGSSALLISRVLYRKQTPLKKFLIIDAAMNNLIRPSLYDAYHGITPLVLNDREPEVYDVVGPICESGDFLAKERSLQPLQQNDLLAVVGAGAYGQAISSNYNLRPTIAEYLVDGDAVQTIFKGQNVEDIAGRYSII